MGANYLVITGGSRGIGESTIQCFMDKGWEAINISRSDCHLPHVKNINIDLSSHENINTHAKELQEAIKSADKVCLVHNAAFYKRDSIHSLSLNNLLTTLEINVISAVVLNQVLIPYMPPESSIIYIGTTLAEKAVPGSASYTISKHAMVGLMRATCQDLMDKKIRACCVNPGLVDTQLLKETMEPEMIHYLLDTKVIGKRLIQPAEIADVIYFCAVTPVLNGVVLPANLGQVAE